MLNMCCCLVKVTAFYYFLSLSKISEFAQQVPKFKDHVANYSLLAPLLRVGTDPKSFSASFVDSVIECYVFVMVMRSSQR